MWNGPKAEDTEYARVKAMLGSLGLSVSGGGGAGGRARASTPPAQLLGSGVPSPGCGLRRCAAAHVSALVQPTLVCAPTAPGHRLPPSPLPLPCSNTRRTCGKGC